MSYKKAPTTFIDDALEKFKAHESERGCRERNERGRSSSQVFEKQQVLMELISREIISDRSHTAIRAEWLFY